MVLWKENCRSAFVVSPFQPRNNQEMPVTKYFEADVSILGFRIPSVGFLVVKDPSTVLESQYSNPYTWSDRMQSDPARV